jgi:hypothetical protein
MTDRAAETLAVVFPPPDPRALTGEVEFSVAEAMAGGRSRPQQVTGVLSAVFARIGSLPADATTLRALGSGVREWLLQQAALRFWRGTGWFEASCVHCGILFDAEAELREAPRGSAGAGYPVIEVETGLGPRRFEAPNGRHEETLARMKGAPGLRDMLALCGLADSARDDAARFSEGDMARIADRFDAICPDVADELTLTCPSCGAATQARLDPLTFAFPTRKALLAEVHQIARAYHWRESEILALPATRRRAYAAMIRAEKGARA